MVRMKKVIALSLIIVCIVMVFVACGDGGSSGDKFLGTWEKAEKGKTEMTITKDGDNYSIKDNVGTIPAVYKDGNLIANNGVSQVIVTIDDSGYLNIGGEKYKKIK